MCPGLWISTPLNSSSLNRKEKMKVGKREGEFCPVGGKALLIPHPSPGSSTHTNICPESKYGRKQIKCKLESDKNIGVSVTRGTKILYTRKMGKKCLKKKMPQASFPDLNHSSWNGRWYSFPASWNGLPVLQHWGHCTWAWHSGSDLELLAPEIHPSPSSCTQRPWHAPTFLEGTDGSRKTPTPAAHTHFSGKKGFCTSSQKNIL